jgi:steroid 5-alpha reductase family enzyme
MTALPLFGVATLVLGLLFAGLFVICLRIKNFGFVDVAWSYGFTIVAVLFAIFGEGWGTRKWLIAGMTTLWSLRLGTHLFRRVLRHHPEEDGRYQTLRKEWQPNMEAKFFVFFEFQALLIAAFCLPVLIACRNPAPTLSLLEIAGVVVWLIAFLGEALADWQMDCFKARPTSKGAVCEDGLWNYSRHPNYFFESLIWWAYFLFAAASPLGWITIYCPLLMLFFLFRVTGIPATEEQAVRSKGAVYREYQRTTSAFIPWFKKS